MLLFFNNFLTIDQKIIFAVKISKSSLALKQQHNLLNTDIIKDLRQYYQNPTKINLLNRVISKDLYSKNMANFQSYPFVKIDNEDQSYYVFLKHLDLGSLKQLVGTRCRRVYPLTSTTNKIKRYNIQFEPSEGTYTLQYQGKPIYLKVQRGQAKLTTQCRKIQYLKDLTIYGETLSLVQDFVKHIYSKAEAIENLNSITIYQNNGGYWNVSKEKKPRLLESVIFKEQFVNSIVSDIKEFVDSQAWYAKMCIPYKRSYLLFGPPGTGKSSLAQALAAAVNFSICFVNCSDNINDFNFNKLLNTAPKKSIILIEDVDSIFSQRKNVEKNNNLTFSGFLNSIDGVRSQEGRIIIMTTNFKERLDPALLRPGRCDQMFEVPLANRYQIQKLCFRFFQDQKLAKQFSSFLPEQKFSMSMIQGYLLRHRKNPGKIIEDIDNLLQSDQNVKIEQFLTELGCQECLNDFKLEECYTLSSAKNLPKLEVQKIVSKLNPLLKGRLIESLRGDRKSYLKSHQQMEKYIDQLTNVEQYQRQLRFFCLQNKYNSIFLVKDKLKQLSERKAAETK